MPKVLFTEHNEASKTLATALIGLGYQSVGTDVWKKGGAELINTHAPTVLDVLDTPIRQGHFDADYLIVLSSHKSKHDQHALTAHFPGNWGKADFGGNDHTLNIAYASKLKLILQEMKKLDTENEWQITLEADHHGPTCGIPIIFVEIGSTEKEWNDRNGASIVARAVEKAITTETRYKTVFAIGSGHYADEFTKIELEDGSVAVGHILPKYHLKNLTEDLFRQAIEKNVENVSEVFALKESTNVAQRELIKKLCDENGIIYTNL